MEIVNGIFECVKTFVVWVVKTTTADGVLAICAVLALMSNWKISRKQINADVNLKSKISKLKIVKGHISEYVSYIYDANGLLVAYLQLTITQHILYENIQNIRVKSINDKDLEENYELTNNQLMTIADELNRINSLVIKEKIFISMELSDDSDEKELLDKILNVSDHLINDISNLNELDNKSIAELEKERERLVKFNDKCALEIGELVNELASYFDKQYKTIKI